MPMKERFLFIVIAALFVAFGLGILALAISHRDGWLGLAGLAFLSGLGIVASSRWIRPQGQQTVLKMVVFCLGLGLMAGPLYPLIQVMARSLYPWIQVPIMPSESEPQAALSGLLFGVIFMALNMGGRIILAKSSYDARIN
ncbi:MAG: hypothetical protein ACREN8_00110 [Candidatus Dormibacteraceae bacterium]